ncbi:MAG: sodium-independent anion transporter, partial [Rhodococcus sp.]|nr:sodium-independent anion transporter [Rhodococcus sp. (in: high G+C Gram-positive bacteria)]
GEEGEVERTYRVHGHLFFATSNTLADHFDYANDPDGVTIDFTTAHLWDATTIAALDAVEDRYRRRGKTVTLVGLDEHSAALHARLSLTG